MAQLSPKQLKTLEGIEDPGKREFYHNLWMRAAEWREREKAMEELKDAQRLASPTSAYGDGRAQPVRRKTARHKPKSRPGLRRGRPEPQYQEPAPAREASDIDLSEHLPMVEQQEAIVVLTDSSALAMKWPDQEAVPTCARHRKPMRETHLWKGGWCCDDCLVEHRSRPQPMDRSTHRAFFLAAAEGMGTVFLQSPQLLHVGQPLTTTAALAFARFMQAYEHWKRSLG